MVILWCIDRPLSTKLILVVIMVYTWKRYQLSTKIGFGDPYGVMIDLYYPRQAIYAVGDCCTKFQFTHAADFMARIVIRNALFFGEPPIVYQVYRMGRALR